MTALITADWSPYARDRYFRRIEVSSMLWRREVNLESCTLNAAQNGGPIVVLRDRAKSLKLQSVGSNKPIVAIYTSSGKLLSSFIWDKGQLVQLGWSSSEDLLCIQEDGKVLIYNIFGIYQHAWDIFLMASTTKFNDSKIVSASIFPSPGGTGIAVLTSANEVFVVNNVSEQHRRVRQLPKAPGAPTSWSVICEDRQTRLIMSKQQSLYMLDQSSQSPTLQKIDLGAGSEKYSIVNIAVSPDYQKIALFISNGKLWIKSSDLRTNYRLFDTQQLSEPKQIVWCASEAVVCYWGSTLTVIGCQEDDLSYFYEHPVFLVSELDCMRVLSAETHDIIQCVPQVVQEMFKINSVSPGSYLLEASKQFQKKSHRANEYIHIVKPNLIQAVTQCIEAAGHEFCSDTQKMLLTAARFGKSFVQKFDSNSFVKMCRILRILNAIRDGHIGIAITYEQFQNIGVEKLIDMIILRRCYYLALEVSKYLRLADEKGATRILSHWAYYKVKQPVIDKNKVAQEIYDKVGRTSGVSYTKIAKEAASNGNKELAIKILDYEPCATNQVPCLLNLQKEKEALVKAIESGNADLVYMVIFSMKTNMAQNTMLKDFQMEIRKYPMARSLYLKYCKSHNEQALSKFYKEEDNWNMMAAIQIKEAFSPNEDTTKEASLRGALENYKKDRNDFAATICEEELKLMKYQKDHLVLNLVGLTLHETLEKLLYSKKVKEADSLRTEFKVPDRRYWWLRIKALGHLKDWTSLDKFSKSKKSPIGYEPFVDICLERDNKTEASKYLPKVRDEEKVKYYVKMGLLDQALQLAVQSKDIDGLEYIANESNSARHIEEAFRILTQMGSKR